MSRKVQNQSLEVFIFAIGERKKYSNKNKAQNGRRREERLQILRWMQKRWTARVGWDTPAQGLFPGARLLISKGTGLEDPCWSRGVHGYAYSKMLQQQHLNRLSMIDAMCFLLPGSPLPLNYLQKESDNLTSLVGKWSQYVHNIKSGCGTDKQKAAMATI